MAERDVRPLPSVTERDAKLARRVSVLLVSQASQLRSTIRFTELL